VNAVKNLEIYYWATAFAALVIIAALRRACLPACCKKDDVHGAGPGAPELRVRAFRDAALNFTILHPRTLETT
jgi:hypothetical protein